MDRHRPALTRRWALLLAVFPAAIALAATISDKRVTYDLARQMKGAIEVKTSEFAEAIVSNL